jgi:hypothetical protein
MKTTYYRSDVDKEQMDYKLNKEDIVKTISLFTTIKNKVIMVSILILNMEMLQ